MNRRMQIWPIVWAGLLIIGAIVYLIGNYLYWVQGMGPNDTLFAATITLWPFGVAALIVPFFYAEWRWKWITQYPGDCALVGITVPFWLDALYAWKQGLFGYPPDPAIAAFIGFGIPMIIIATWGKRHPSGFEETSRWIGRTLNRYYKLIWGLGTVTTIGALFFGIMQMTWGPFWIIILTPFSLWGASLLRSLLMGFTQQGVAGFVDGEIRHVEFYDGSEAAPQHIHPVGIWYTAKIRAQNWTYEVLPVRIWMALLPIRLALITLSAWWLLDPVAKMVGSTEFPPFPFVMEDQWVAALEIGTLVFVLFLGKKIRPGWMIITLPLWSIAALDAAAIVWGNERIHWYWILTWIPHLYYAAAVWSRTMFGFTTDYRIFVTSCKFGWWILTTPKRSGEISGFKQDLIDIQDVGLWKLGLFDPGMLQLGADEEIMASYLPHPDKFRYALQLLQREQG